MMERDSLHQFIQLFVFFLILQWQSYVVSMDYDASIKYCKRVGSVCDMPINSNNTYNSIVLVYSTKRAKRLLSSFRYVLTRCFDKGIRGSDVAQKWNASFNTRL